MSEVHVQVTRYAVSVLPADHQAARYYTITVEYRGGDTWAVCWDGEVLAVPGGWGHEPLPSARTDEWLATHRFDLNRALALARVWAPRLTVNGITAEQAQARWDGT